MIKRSDALFRIADAGFDGYVQRIRMEKVARPLLKGCCGETLRLADDGYCWMTGLERNADYAVTMAYDPQENVVQCYIDVLAGEGVDEQGPYMEDCYLDILMLPDGRHELIDVEELEEALQQGQVTQGQYDAAWATARRLEPELAQVYRRYQKLFDSLLHRDVTV